MTKTIKRSRKPVSSKNIANDDISRKTLAVLVVVVIVVSVVGTWLVVTHNELKVKQQDTVYGTVKIEILPTADNTRPANTGNLNVGLSN